jgi:hypothetical protein
VACIGVDESVGTHTVDAAASVVACSTVAAMRTIEGIRAVWAMKKCDGSVVELFVSA